MLTEHTEYTEYVYTHVRFILYNLYTYFLPGCYIGNGHASLISGYRYHTCNARGVYIFQYAKMTVQSACNFPSVHKQSDNVGTYFDQDLTHEKCVEQD
jgi:hypothetical protein